MAVESSPMFAVMRAKLTVPLESRQLRQLSRAGCGNRKPNVDNEKESEEPMPRDSTPDQRCRRNPTLEGGPVFRIFLTILILTFASSAVAEVASPSREGAIDVIRYSLALRPDLQTGSVSGTETVQFIV